MRLLLYTLFLFFSISVASQLNLSQAANLPVWSKLTPFEMKTLNGLGAAKRGSDEDLLRLFVFASGNLRRDVDYQKIKLKMDKYFTTFGDSLNTAEGIWQKGYLLNRTMHQYFFSNSDDEMSDAYEEDQSQLSEIFRTGKYNCVSSTLLYLYLARRINLHVKAVILPTHTFVELDLLNGSMVEVETTSSTGFDWAHDRKFYKNAAKNWFSERRLAASSFADYQHREIVAPWKLAALNMRNQHTNPDRMSRENRLRLLEAAAYLDNKSEQAWLAVLYAYNEIFIEFNQTAQLKSLISLYDLSYPRALHFINSLYSPEHKLDEVSQWFFSQAGYTYMKFGEQSKARQILLRHYAATKAFIKSSPNIFQNNQIVFSGLLKHYLNQQNYKQADDLIDQIFRLGMEDEQWQQSVIWYFSSRLQPMWEKQQWKNIINFWEDIRSRQLQIRNINDFEKNIEGAYQNYALGFESKGNWRAAAEILLQCTEKVQLALECTKRLEKLKSQHNIF